jgi:4-hydroxy-tetrahydrodipicolinate synthase
MKVKNKQITGVIPAIITPFTADLGVDFAGLEKQAAHLAGHDIAGIFVAGTTGEGYELTTPEKIEVFRKVKSAAKSDQKLFAACLKPTTHQVMGEMKAMASLEPDYIVAVTPYFGQLSQGEIVHHFKKLAGVSPAPLVIYNIPGRTANKISLDSVLELAQYPGIAGIKDSSGDFNIFSRGMISSAGNGASFDGFSWVQGSDSLDAAALLLGADALVSGMSNVWIEPYIKMYQASRAGDKETVLSSQRDIYRLFGITRITGLEIAAIKTACEILGRAERWVRSTAFVLTDKQREDMRSVLVELGLIT